MADSAGLQIQFDNHGLSSFNWQGSNLLAGPQVELQRLRLDSKSAEGNLFDKLSEHFDPALNVLEQTYRWGKARFTYRVNGNRLLVNVDVTSSGNHAITEVGFYLMRVQFPTRPNGTAWEHRYPSMYERADDIPVILADWGTGRLALCSEDLNQPLKFGFQPLQGEPYAISVWFDGSAIKPAATRSAVISIRLAGDEKPGWSIAHDVCASFAKKYPYELKWKDRRPIASLFLATSVAGYKNNPRGWLMDPEIDVNTVAGREEFHSKITKYFDKAIANCKAMNAQGAIVWDLEGQEMPHATSYLADPRILAKAAPEIEPYANEIFKRMNDAGLRTGISIRPTRVVPAADGHGWAQKEIANPVAEMIQKIDYARKRWGCTIFYVDSNVNFMRDEHGKILSDPAMSADDFHTLARKFPDCLLIPEHKTDRYWADTAPYSELRLGISSTPAEIREAYPHAFSVMRVVDGPPLEENTAILADAVRAGDTLLFRAWWDDPENPKIKHIYDQAHVAMGNAN